jgi:hypothetical protein
VPLAVSVKVLEFVGLVVVGGLKEAVTPLGNPEADKLTLPVKPFCGETVTVLPPLAPWTIDKVFGEAEREKFGTRAAVTVRLTVVVLVKVPEVPVMVTVAVPIVAVLLAVSVKVLEFVGLVVLTGLKEAVTPAGKPDAAKLTPLLKPFTGTTAMVLVPLVPCVMVTLLGEAEREKLGTGAAVTVRLMVVVFVKPPEDPVMMTVAVPATAVLLTVSVKVLEFAGLVVMVGLKEAVTPLGNPEAEKLTLPLKPLSEPTETVLVPLAPCMTVKVLGDAESMKLGDVLVMTETLSKVAVARLEVLPLVTARPM